MTTWPETLSYYKDVVDVIHDYGNNSLKTVDKDSVVKNISVQILEKFHINMVGAIGIMEDCEEKPMLFLPLGLILRGIISDLINYRYLIQVQKYITHEDFENEIKILDLDFAKAYKKMVDSEKAIHQTQDDMASAIDAAFKKHFQDFYNGEKLKKDSDFRRPDFKGLLKKYFELTGLDPSTPISSEAGKIKFVQDKHRDRIQLLYTYLSQLQHFSGRANTFYKDKNYVQGNAHFTLMLLFYVALTLTLIVGNLNNDSDTMQKLGVLITAMAKG